MLPDRTAKAGARGAVWPLGLGAVARLSWAFALTALLWTAVLRAIG